MPDAPQRAPYRAVPEACASVRSCGKIPLLIGERREEAGGHFFPCGIVRGQCQIACGGERSGVRLHAGVHPPRGSHPRDCRARTAPSPTVPVDMKEGSGAGLKVGGLKGGWLVV